MHDVAVAVIMYYAAAVAAVLWFRFYFDISKLPYMSFFTFAFDVLIFIELIKNNN